MQKNKIGQRSIQSFFTKARDTQCENAENKPPTLNINNRSPEKSQSNVTIKRKLKLDHCLLDNEKVVDTDESCKKAKLENSVKPLEMVKSENSDGKSSSEDILNELDIAKYTNIDFDLNDFEDEAFEDILDISDWQRCTVTDCQYFSTHSTITLKSIDSDRKCVCNLEGFWKDTSLKVDDIVSIKAQSDKGMFKITNEGGLLILHPDMLITGTELVGSLFCMRKSIMQRNFRGVDGNNKNMVIGTLLHDLLEICLSKQLFNLEDINDECLKLLKDPSSIFQLYDADFSSEDAVEDMKKVTPYMSEFIRNHVKLPKKPAININQNNDKTAWKGYVNKIVDIEENIWVPNLGLSGRIDVTVEVKLPNQKEFSIMPLELKTGRPTGSIEHRGQVMLYTMLMSEIVRNNNSHHNISDGLLLYLREGVNIQQITPNQAEQKDLIILRNRLAQYSKSFLSSDENTLPEPINHHRACSTCPYLTICSIHLQEDPDRRLSDDHLLSKLKNDAIGHLNANDVKYFLHWCKLIKIEVTDEMNNLQKQDIWNLTPTEREKRGKCLSQLNVTHVEQFGNKLIHTFTPISNKDILKSQFYAGEYVVIGTAKRFGETTGFVSQIDSANIKILINRNLLSKHPKSTEFIIDAYESNSTHIYNLTNLGVLMDNTERSNRLRKIIINKEASLKDDKLSNNVFLKGKDVLSPLNPVQQRAILKALASKDYFLIRGMPGTGKTQTIVALVELMILLDMSVIITSQTHSAIDNVLLRLNKYKSKILRIGPEKRIHKDLQCFTDQNIELPNGSTRDLHDFYNRIKVVGVTCLGSDHPLLNKRVFDVCIVDESTQVLQCSILRPLFAANKFILVGDPEQLPPIVKSKRARLFGFDESLFSRLDGLGPMTSLTIQYRMNRSIMTLANIFTYKNLMTCANEKVSEATLNFNHDTKCSWLNEVLSNKIHHAVTILNTGYTLKFCCKELKTTNIYSNICEVLIIKKIIKALLDGGFNSKNIGVISGFRDQVSLLQNHINSLFDADSVNNIEVNTVDQYQGKDKDVIIYSCVKSWKNKDFAAFSGENQILEDKRRLTVAITRAKHKLIIVGDVESVKFYTPFSELLDFISCKNIGQYVNIPNIEEIMNN